MSFIYRIPAGVRTPSGPPPVGTPNKIGFNFRLTGGTVSDVPPDNWTVNVNSSPYPTGFTDDAGLTVNAGWESTPPLNTQLYDVPVGAAVTPRLAGAQSSGAQSWWRVDVPVGTWRVRAACMIYVAFNFQTIILDGSAFGSPTTLYDSGTNNTTANNVIDINAVVRTAAQWNSEYATTYQVVTNTNRGADTGVTFHFPFNADYVSHIQIEPHT